MIQPMQSGRPKAMRSKPVFMDSVFDDPDGVMRLIRDKAPFQTLPAHYGVMGESDYDAHALFRHALTDDVFLHNSNWIEAARKSFDAGIVHPVKCLLNLSAPMEELGVHIDLPTFRGFDPASEIKRLLMAMIHSALFYDWMVPFASGLVWFYRGEGGAFLYWDEGVEAPPSIVRPPFWNTALEEDPNAIIRPGSTRIADECLSVSIRSPSMMTVELVAGLPFTLTVPLERRTPLVWEKAGHRKRRTIAGIETRRDIEKLLNIRPA